MFWEIHFKALLFPISSDKNERNKTKHFPTYTIYRSYRLVNAWVFQSNIDGFSQFFGIRILVYTVFVCLFVCLI